MKKKAVFEGSCVALITPMRKDCGIDFETLGKLIEFQVKNKIDAIVSCGTTAETTTLMEDEYVNVVDFTIRKVNKRVPVIVGSGSNNTKRALELSLKAQTLGADALLIVTPYYNKTSQLGVVKHYNFIADKVSTPIIIYNVPSRTGLDITPETYKELSKHKNIIATKEASEDIGKIAKIFSLCKNNLDIYCGNDNQIIPFLSLGSKGVISVFANAFPKKCREITKKYFTGKQEESVAIFLKYLEVINYMFCDVNPIPIKFIMKQLNMIPSCKCRLPLTQINPFCKEKVIEAVKKLDFI